MNIIEPSYKIESDLNYSEILKHIEKCGRTAYKSEDKISTDSAEKFIKMIIKSGHESVLEHFNISIRFICDRGVTHELVRHRLCAYTQESTRYCNYAKKDEITVIRPLFFESESFEGFKWYQATQECENTYLKLIERGAKPQEARSVLPNSLKTEIVCTTNLREWRYILKLRTHKTAHPQMRQIMLPLLHELKQRLPVFFEDIIE